MSNKHNLVTMLSTGGGSTVEAAMQTARGFHHAAGELEALQLQRTLPQTLDQAWLDAVMGRTAGAAVLEALAVEIVLKARLLRAGFSSEDLRLHDHSALYALLPDTEKREAEQRYQSSRHRAMRPTLAEALSFSAKVFEQWRYMHERQSVQASTGEMQRAYAALAEGM